MAWILKAGYQDAQVFLTVVLCSESPAILAHGKQQWVGYAERIGDQDVDVGSVPDDL